MSTKKAKTDFDSIKKMLCDLGFPLCDSNGSTDKLKSFTPQFARTNVQGYEKHADDLDGRKFVWLPGDTLLFDDAGNFIAIEDSQTSTVFIKIDKEK